MTMVTTIDGQLTQAETQQDAQYHELVDAGREMAVGFGQMAAEARGELEKAGTDTVKKAEKEIERGDLLGKQATEGQEKVALGYDTFRIAAEQQIARTKASWGYDGDTGTGWRDSVKDEIATATGDGVNYVDAVKTASDEQKAAMLKTLNETIETAATWHQDKQFMMDDLLESLKEKMQDKFAEHGKNQAGVVEGILSVSSELKKISDAIGSSDQPQSQMGRVAKLVDDLNSNAELVAGMDKKPFKMKTEKLENDLKDITSGQVSDIEQKYADLEAQLKTMIDTYQTNVLQYSRNADTHTDTAKGSYTQRALKLKNQQKELLGLYTEAEDTAMQEQEMKNYMVQSFNDVGALQAQTTQSLSAQAKHAYSGANKDIEARTSMMGTQLDRSQGEEFPPEEEALEEEGQKIATFGGKVTDDLNEQSEEEKTLAANVAKFGAAVLRYGPYTQKALAGLNEDIKGLQGEVSDYTPQLRTMANMGLDALWQSVQASLDAYKERSNNMNAAENDAFYKKLKAMRPADPNFDLARQAMRKGLSNVETTQELRKEFEKQAAIEESKAAAGMGAVAHALDGMADELNAKAVAANAMANHAGRQLMGDVRDAEAQASNSKVADELSKDESETNALITQAQGGVAAEGVATQGSPDMSSALQALMGMSSAADRNFKVLQMGEERQKALRAQWLATVVGFVKGLAESLDPDFIPPPMQEAAA